MALRCDVVAAAGDAPDELSVQGTQDKNGAQVCLREGRISYFQFELGLDAWDEAFEHVPEGGLHFLRAQIFEADVVALELIERQVQAAVESILPKIAQDFGLPDARTDPTGEFADRDVLGAVRKYRRNQLLHDAAAA